MKSTPENRVKKKLDRWLSENFDWHQSLSDRFHAGLPDRIALLNSNCRATVFQKLCNEGNPMPIGFYAFECKSPGKSLTKIQKVTLRRMASAAAHCFVVTLNQEADLEFTRIETT